MRSASTSPRQVAREPEAPVDRERVRARVDDPAGRVEAHEAVPTRGESAWSPRWPSCGNAAAGDHLGQAPRRLEVGQLEAARRPDAEQVGVARDERDRPAGAADRDDLDPDGDVVSPLRVALAHQPTGGVERLVEHPSAPAGHEGARRRRRRSAVGPVVGRIWPPAQKPPALAVGSHSTRSAKDRSAMICQSAMSRHSHSTSSSSRSVWARASCSGSDGPTSGSRGPGARWAGGGRRRLAGCATCPSVTGSSVRAARAPGPRRPSPRRPDRGAHLDARLPRPELRDGIAYPVLATWVDRGVYDDLLVGLGDGMVAGLAVGLGE